MKKKLCKVLHIFGFDALLVRLLEKLVTALNKKLATVKEQFKDFLDYCHQTTCECAL